MTRMKQSSGPFPPAQTIFGAGQFCSTLVPFSLVPLARQRGLLCAFFYSYSVALVILRAPCGPFKANYSVICYGVSFRMILATLLSFFPSSPSSRLISHRFEQVHYTPGEQCRRCGGVAPASFVETSTRTDHSLVPVSTNSVSQFSRLGRT
jgi:hypothetical protein